MGKHAPPRHASCVLCNNDAVEETKNNLTTIQRSWSLNEIGFSFGVRAAGNGFGFGIADPDGVARTLSARYYKDGSEILIEQDGKNPRRLTPRECARLQGFPDDFVIPVSDTQAYKQFGNSVVVPLMTNVAQLVVAKMKELDAEAVNDQKTEQIVTGVIEPERRAVAAL